MKLSTAITQITLFAAAATASAQLPPESEKLASDVLKIFKARCFECHGKDAVKPAEFGFIDDLTKLHESDYVDLRVPENSPLYREIQEGNMPRLTKAEKEAGKKRAEPLNEEQVATVLSWLRANAPTGPGAAIAQNDTKPEPAKPAPPPDSEPPKPPVKVARKLVTPQEEITAALTDLQTAPREEQAETRYVSLAAVHNNTRFSETQIENLRRGARKLLNSLSTNPRIATFPEVGPEKVLLRVKLRDIGWSAAIWDEVASHCPQTIETGVSKALGAASSATVPILRADWMAATAARPPLYHTIMGLPKRQQELEKELGVDVAANLNAGEVVRAGLIRSGVSLANRLVERHDLRLRSGYYWVSYDFRSSKERSNLLEFPLGPESVRLAGGQHAFKHAGGEFVFSLPNGLNGYYVADVLGNRIDGAAPTDIVNDRNGVTGRVEVSNGLSCIICHDRGIKPMASNDAIRAIASKFNAEEQRLIERLHPVPDAFNAIIEKDAARFAAAIKEANAETVAGQAEPVGALAAAFDREVTLETAAAEVGLSADELSRKLEEQNQLFELRASFKGGGTLLREHFVDFFAGLVERLDIGKVRRDVRPVAVVPLPGRTATPRPIAVEVRTDKATYTEGEDLVVTVQAAESGHLRLLYQNAAGEIYTLFPNQFITDDRIEGGRAVKVMPVPNPKKPGDEVAIQITGPNFGTEYVAAIVTDQPFTDEAALKEQMKSVQFAKSTARDIEGAITKDARVISRPAREGASGGARAGFARATLTTVKK